ncbi:MAG TPA: phage tail protein [Cytophagales bacterium]|nr:phage tail protein [Cytophagales bacterium]
MAGEAQEAAWPLPKFRFVVDWGDQTNISFQEISGIDTETQIIEYRESNSKIFSTVKMPGIVKSSNVTMKRGIFVNDFRFWNWYNKIKMNTIERIKVVIKLLDQEGNPIMTWELSNAWPTKISATDLKSDGNEVAIDTIEIAHEGLSLQEAPKAS